MLPKHSLASLVMTVKHLSVDTGRQRWQIGNYSSRSALGQADIKSIQLLPNCLASRQPQSEGPMRQ